MYIDGCEDIIKLIYDETRPVKGTGLYIVRAGQLLGLFDTYRGKLVVPTKFTGMTYQGPSLTFHDVGAIGSYALLYIKETHKTVEFKDGLYSTRVAGSVKLFMSSTRRLLVVRRNNGSIALDTQYIDIQLPNRADSGWMACSIRTITEKRYIILNNGYVHTLESYLKEKYNSVYIVEGGEDGFESYLAVDENLVAVKLDSLGRITHDIGKVVDINKLNQLRRVI